jgi:NAD dependent epimerase/dehydratase family enzyme
MQFLLTNEGMSGPVNLTAPLPASNAELTRAIAKALHRPALLRVPPAVLRVALGELSIEVLGSIRAIPARLEAAGFTFRHPTVGPAVAAAIARRT